MAVIFTWRWKLFACVFFTHVLRTEKLMRHWKPWIHIYIGSNWRAHEEPKKFVKSPCYVTIDISRAFLPKQTQVKICLQIQRNWVAVSLFYRYISNYSERFQIPLIIQRHLQGTDLFERKRLPKKKYRHLRKVWILSFLLLCRQAVFALITVKFSRAVVRHDQLFKIIFFVSFDCRRHFHTLNKVADGNIL